MATHKGLPVERAIEKLRLRAGTDFDPGLFKHIANPANELYAGVRQRFGRRP